MQRDSRLALIAFPLVFLPAALCWLFNDVLFRPSVWWGFHLSYAVGCFLALSLLWFVLRADGLGFRDIGLRDFRLSHLGWGFLFFLVAGSVWRGVTVALERLNLRTTWGSEIRFTHAYEVLIIFVYAVIAAPLAEELLFRGFFITFVGKLVKPWVAASWALGWSAGC